MEYDYLKSELAKHGYKIIEHPDQPWPNAVRDIQELMHSFLATEAPELLGNSASPLPVLPCLPTTKQPKSIRLRVSGMESSSCECACDAMNREVSLDYIGDCVYYTQWQTGCSEVPVQYAEVTFTGEGHFDFILAAVGDMSCSCQDANHIGKWDGSKPYLFKNECKICGAGLLTLTAVFDG